MGREQYGAVRDICRASLVCLVQSGAARRGAAPRCEWLRVCREIGSDGFLFLCWRPRRIGRIQLRSARHADQQRAARKRPGGSTLNLQCEWNNFLCLNVLNLNKFYFIFFIYSQLCIVKRLT